MSVLTALGITLAILVAAAAGGYWSARGPLIITLLLRVSGVTMLERDLTRSKPGYQEYFERTSAFIPWRPRRTTRLGDGGETP